MKLLRSSAIYSQLNENTTKDIYNLISTTADAYNNASLIAPESSAATHARFLTSLVSNDVFVRRNDQKHELAIDPQLEREILVCFAYLAQFLKYPQLRRNPFIRSLQRITDRRPQPMTKFSLLRPICLRTLRMLSRLRFRSFSPIP